MKSTTAVIYYNNKLQSTACHACPATCSPHRLY